MPDTTEPVRPKELPLDVPEKKPVSKAMQRQARKLVENWTSVNPGGAPISEEFVIAAMQQGLTAKEVKAIIRSQALGGPRTSASFSSGELLDYFTTNPTEIPSLLEAVRSTRNAPATYAEYLAQGGVPGAFRPQNMLLQEAVLGIGGASQAYLAGTHRAMFVAEGNDPNRWHLEGPEWMAGLAETEKNDAAKSAVSSLSAQDLLGLSDAATKMLQSRQARAAAQGDFFDANEIIGDVE